MPEEAGRRAYYQVEMPRGLDRVGLAFDGAPPSAAWRQAVAELERRFAADADCRRPAYEAGLRVVAERIDDWEARHRGEIAAVRAQWQQRTDDAAKIRR